MKKHWDLVMSLAILWGVTTVVIVMFFLRCDAGTIVYALDDGYIHLAMAKNLVHSGVFGVTSHEFSASSSSPLWTLLLAAVALVVGTREITPFVLNLLSASALVLIVHRFLLTHQTNRIGRFFTLLGVILLTPLVPLGMTGMEHVLQALLTLLFLSRSACYLGDDTHRVSLPELLLLAVLTASVRFEGLFAIIVAVFTFFRHGRVKGAVYLLAAGLLPVIVYGVVSVWNGSYPLPNSILGKANVPLSLTPRGILTYCLQSVDVIINAPYLFVLILIAAFLLIVPWKGSGHEVGHLFTIWFLMITFLHAQFARTGWFYRYDSYLVMLGIVAIAMRARSVRPLLRELPGDRPLHSGSVIVLFLCGGCALYPVANRGLQSLIETPTAMTNIYKQQYQMGLFLQRYYPGESIAVNDIGAVCFLADPRLFDLNGLGTIDVMKSKMNRSYDSSIIRFIAERRHVRMAIVYDSFFPGSLTPDNVGKSRQRLLPAHWIRVGRWRLLDHVVVCASKEVSFYATDDTGAVRLKAHLAEFRHRLPAGILVSEP